MGPITNLLSVLCVLIEILSCAHTKGGKKGHSDLKFGTFIGRFQSDGAASMEVKGLKTANQLCRNKRGKQTALDSIIHFKRSI